MPKRKTIKRITIHKIDTEEAMNDAGLHFEEPGDWWLRDPNNKDCPWVGPYDTKVEAQEGKRGLEAFWRYHVVD